MSGSRFSIFRNMVAALACFGLLGLGACESASKSSASLSGENGGGSGDEYGDSRGGPRDADARYEWTGELQDIYFDYDKSEIRSDQRDTLAVNADWIKRNPNVRVQVEGHCDERGTEEYNLALGERRANAIRDYLISFGVEADRIYAISYGEEMPVDPGHNESAWAQNRRAHFLVNR